MAEIPSYDFLTLGETLLRLSPPGVQRPPVDNISSHPSIRDLMSAPARAGRHDERPAFFQSAQGVGAVGAKDNLPMR